MLYEKLTFARDDKIGGEGSHPAGCVHRPYVRNLRIIGKLNVCLNPRVQLFQKILRKLFSVAAFNKIGRDGSRTIHIGYACKQNAIFLLKNLNLCAANRGAILIEFAVCMPILIILLFYINDLVKLKRLNSQMEFVGQQMANILQNISQKRSGASRAITSDDIKYAASLAYLSVFPGKSRFNSTAARTSDLGYSPLGWVYCVKGNSSTKASLLWTRRFYTTTSYTPTETAIDDKTNRSNVKKLTNASTSEIYPTLKINNDEIKIIIECAIHYYRSSRYAFSDGRKTSEVSASQAFGLRLFNLTPKPTRDGANNDAIYFHSTSTFVPNPGLFSETVPN